jgi:hypothetical protein
MQNNRFIPILLSETLLLRNYELYLLYDYSLRKSLRVA